MNRKAIIKIVTSYCDIADQTKGEINFSIKKGEIVDMKVYAEINISCSCMRQLLSLSTMFDVYDYTSMWVTKSKDKEVYYIKVHSFNI